MGYLGFYFEILDEKKVIIVDAEKLNGNYVIGISNSFNHENCSFHFLDKDLCFKEFTVLSNSLFRYAKISLSDKTVIDFSHLTMWFNSKKYRELRQLFDFDQKASLDEIRSRVNTIYEYFI